MSRRPSPLDNEKCRHCTTFQDYVKSTKKKLEDEEGKKGFSTDAASPAAPPRDDCPLDREQLGNRTWGLLHTIAATYPERPTRTEQRDIKEFFRIFSNVYPCDSCAHDFKKELVREPIQTTSQEAFSQWLCRIHNRVNVKLGKEKFDCSKVNERWRDGWLDGSCD